MRRSPRGRSSAMTGADGRRPTVERGKWVAVWRREADGQWRVVTDIANTDAQTVYAVDRVAFPCTGGDVPHVHAHFVPMHQKTDITSAQHLVGPTAPDWGSDHLIVDRLALEHVTMVMRDGALFRDLPALRAALPFLPQPTRK